MNIPVIQLSNKSLFENSLQLKLSCSLRRQFCCESLTSWSYWYCSRLTDLTDVSSITHGSVTGRWSMSAYHLRLTVISFKTRLCCSYDKFKPWCHTSELHKVHCPCLPVTVIIALKTRLCCSYDKFKPHCSSELHSLSIVPARQWLSAPERFGFYADIVHLSILPP